MTFRPIEPSAVLDTLPVETQRRLIAVRGALILGESVGVGLIAGLLNARLPLAALGSIITLHLGLNVVAWMRLRQGGIGPSEVMPHLAVDAAGIAALVYLTGGYANPFISLLLVPLILAAVTLPPLHAWGMAVWVGVLYTLLMRFYRPLAIHVSPEAAVDLHLSGMWLNFLLTAALVAAFAGRLASTLRRRDAELAEARERRLRDEQLFALGLQAASAAHDLATPMASTRITLDELRRDYAGDDELEQPLALLSGQLSRMESVLDRLGRAARARATGAPETEEATVWLARVLEHWGLMWPNARVRANLTERVGNINGDAALESVMVTLLNNAAQASSSVIEVSLEKSGDRVTIQVADQGQGSASDTVKPSGWGVGLELARATLARIGGTLILRERAGGGLVARMEIPLSARS